MKMAPLAAILWLPEEAVALRPAPAKLSISFVAARDRSAMAVHLSGNKEGRSLMVHAETSRVADEYVVSPASQRVGFLPDWRQWKSEPALNPPMVLLSLMQFEGERDEESLA
jgi:hypothetical protein